MKYVGGVTARELTLPEVSSLSDILLTLTHRHECPQGFSIYDIFPFVCWSHHTTFIRRTEVLYINFI